MRALVLFVAIAAMLPSRASAQAAETDAETEAVARATVTPPPVVEAPLAGESWPSIGRPDGVVNPRIQIGKDLGLIIAGAATFGAAYVASIAFALGEDADQNCVEYIGGTNVSGGCGSWPWAFVPFGGGIAQPFINEYGSRSSSSFWWLIAQVPLVTAQIVGLIVALVGLAGQTEAIVSAQLGPVELVPSAPAAELGASLRASF